MTQPDGSKSKVYVSGDEFYQEIRSVDGYTLVQDKNSGLVSYAMKDPATGDLVPSGVMYRGTARSEVFLPGAGKLEKGLAPDPGSIRRTIALRLEGRLAKTALITPVRRLPPTVKGLVLLINFTDVKSTITQGAVDSFCNFRGYKGYGNNGSVRDYYNDISGGRLDYTIVTTAFYTAKNNKAYYSNPNQALGVRASELISEALQGLAAKGFDFSTLTADSTKNILGINALYAGPIDVANGGLWPHSGFMKTPFSANGATISRYQITFLYAPMAIRVFCHENGHLICDYPDTYDYLDRAWGCGNFDLMSCRDTSHENPGAISFNPPPPDPYCRAVITGWDTMTVMNTLPHLSTVRVGANPASNQSVFRWNGPSAAKEYFMAENFCGKGRYANAGDTGLCIWHIDTAGSNDYYQMTASQHYVVSVEQADGLYNLERTSPFTWPTNLFSNDLFHAGGNNEFNYYTTPNSRWWNAASSGFDIYSISTVGDTMTFTLRNPPVINNSLLLVNDDDARVIYTGAWTDTALTGGYNTDNHIAKTLGPSVSFSFTGTEIRVIGRMTTNQGLAKVYIDGVLVDTIDFYSPTNRFQAEVLVLGSLSAASHTIRIDAMGTRNTRSTGVLVNIDAFAFLKNSTAAQVVNAANTRPGAPSCRRIGTRSYAFIADPANYRSFEIIAVSGKTVERHRLSSYTVWNANHVAPGLYVARFSGAGRSFCRNIVVD